MSPITTAKVVSWLGVILLGIATTIGLLSVLRPSWASLDFANFLVVIAGALIACSQLALFRLQITDEWKRRQRERSLSYSIINNPNLLQARDHLEKIFQQEFAEVTTVSREKYEAVSQRSPGDAESFNPVMLKYLLAHWGNLALTIYGDVADEALAFDMVGSLLVDHVKIFAHYIQDIQHQDPSAYVYLTHLAKAWQQRLQRGSEAAYIPSEKRMSFEERIAFLKGMEHPGKDGV